MIVVGSGTRYKFDISNIGELIEPKLKEITTPIIKLIRYNPNENRTNEPLFKINRFISLNYLLGLATHLINNSNAMIPIPKGNKSKGYFTYCVECKENSTMELYIKISIFSTLVFVEFILLINTITISGVKIANPMIRTIIDNSIFHIPL